MQTTDKSIGYIQDNPSPYRTTVVAAARLGAAGFTHLKEDAPWASSPGQCYYATRNQSNLIAFRLPGGTSGDWRMIAAHSDSLTLYVRDDALKGGKRYARLTVEGCGGMNCASWLDRPLTVTGQAVVCTLMRMEERLVYLDQDLLTIPSLATHQQRDVNRGHDYSTQEDMQPLYALGGGPSLTTLPAEELGMDAGDILATSLVLCPRRAPVYIGPRNEFLQTSRIDDLGCAYVTLEGLLNAKDTERLEQLYCLSNGEEVGSGTRQGAMSSLPPDVLIRTRKTLGLSVQARRQALAGSLLLSADNGHAVHLNLPEKTDPANKVYPNGGVVIEYSASQKYTTTGLTTGLLQAICQRAGMLVQVLASRADGPGGSTLGNLLGHRASILMMNIGMAQLVMHSAVETTGSRGPEYVTRACAAFFRAEFIQTTGGVYQFWFQLFSPEKTGPS